MKIQYKRVSLYRNVVPPQIKALIGCIDLTNLDVQATQTDIKLLCKRAYENETAAVCVNPIYVKFAAMELLNLASDGLKPRPRVVGVIGGFPLSATFSEVKLLETKMVLDAGANEVDMVINVPALLSGNDQLVCEEIEACKALTSEAGVPLKVILESSNLGSSEMIRKASRLAILAGADFIKTSTGFGKGGATPEAIQIMATVIAEHLSETGHRVGIKPSGGIRSAEQAKAYAKIVRSTIDDTAALPAYFRFGASGLLQALLSNSESMTDY
ncbi:MAG: deoxyribose-phosphate aldolase [Candidatus Marinamargulisbacteria bacterium]|jgi:deoxyribose-phosphate aldolase